MTQTNREIVGATRFFGSLLESVLSCGGKLNATDEKMAWSNYGAEWQR
jgi:hypothetical protein